MSSSKTNRPHGRGGPGRGQGRKPEPGWVLRLQIRVYTPDEEAAIRALTPRERAVRLTTRPPDPPVAEGERRDE